MSASTSELVTSQLCVSLRRPHGTNLIEANREHMPENVLTAESVQDRFEEILRVGALHKEYSPDKTEFVEKVYEGTSTVVDFNGIPLAERTYWKSGGVESGFVPKVYCVLHGNENGQAISYGFREFENKKTGARLVVYHCRIGDTPTFQFHGDKSWYNPELQKRIGEAVGIFKK